MGLGGRREKQVIAADPRNTRWINDTSSPGHRLLSSMGYDPANANSSQHKTGLYGHNASKRLKQIPIAKGGMEGIGYKPNGPGANVALGALPSRMGGVPNMASAASNIFSKLGSRAALQFVTAGSSREVINKAKTEGGEYGGLLARLNAASSASATPEPVEIKVAEVVVEQTEMGGEESASDEDEKRERKKQRKLEKAAKKERKLAKKLAKQSTKEQSPESSESSTTLSSTPANTAETSQLPPENVHRIQHWNASRSRNLKAKRMLHASAEAMAEILGIAPTPSPSVSGYSTPTSLPATISSQPALASQPVIAEAAVSDKDTDKLKRKAEKKAAKAIEASRSDTQSDTTGAEGKERKKKRKREV